MLSKAFWIETGERALKTAAQAGLLAFGAVTWTDVGDVIETAQAVGLALLAGAVLSVLTSLASLPFGPGGSPSLVSGVPVPEPEPEPGSEMSGSGDGI